MLCIVRILYQVIFKLYSFITFLHVNTFVRLRYVFQFVIIIKSKCRKISDKKVKKKVQDIQDESF